LRFFSDRDRPVHLGPYPLERLARGPMPDRARAPAFAPLTFRRPDAPASITNAMAEYQAMLDAIRDGMVNRAVAEAPSDPAARANHLRAFGYFSDAAMAATCALPDLARLATPFLNPDIDRLAADLRQRQTKTLASGIDVIMADLRDSMQAPPSDITAHRHAIVFLYDHPRPSHRGEPGTGWIPAPRPTAPACGPAKRRW